MAGEKEQQHEQQEINLLLTSAGRRTYLVDWFREALEKRRKRTGVGGRLYVANSTPLGAALWTYSADESWISPPIAADTYLPALQTYCRTHRITAVIPLLDADVAALSDKEAENAFGRIGTRLLVPARDVVRLCDDKLAMFRFLRQHGIGVPVTYTLETFHLRVERIGFPGSAVIMKPRYGAGSRKTFRLPSLPAIAAVLDAEKAGTAYIFQPEIQGEEYNLDILSDLDGHYCNTIVKRKLGMRAGETDAAEVLPAAMPAARILGRLGEQLAELLPHPGDLDCDVILTPEGQPFVLDLNARIGGGYPFAHMAGADLPGAMVAWLAGERVPPALLQAHRRVCAMKAPALYCAPLPFQVSAEPWEWNSARTFCWRPAFRFEEFPEEEAPGTAVGQEQEVTVPEDSWKLVRLRSRTAIRTAITGLGDYLTPPLSARGEGTAEKFCDKLFTRGRVIAVTAAGAGIIGAVGFYENTGYTAHGTFLAVVPAWRNHGVGRSLFEAVTADARARGMTRLCFTMHTGNDKALAFYRHLGCSVVGSCGDGQNQTFRLEYPLERGAAENAAEEERWQKRTRI